MSKPTSVDTTTTPCDVCGGGTYALEHGSIWCPAEDPHPGGHFVTRLMFERRPNQATPIKSRTSATTARTAPISRRPVVTPKVEDPYASGFDAFIGKDK